MAAPRSSPKDAQVMQAILKDMGVTDYEPRVINGMLELAYRYVTDVLDDAKVFSTHAGKKAIDGDDVKLSVQCKMDNSFTSPPPKDLLLDIARHKNSQPLPAIKPYTSPRLPPDRYCLSSANYKLKSLKKAAPQVTHRVQISSLTPGARLVSSVVQPHGQGTPGTVNIVTGNPTTGQSVVISKPSIQGIPSFRITTGPSTSSVSSVLSAVNPPKRKIDDEDDDYDNL